MAGANGDAPLWTPSPATVERAEITRYTDWLAAERGLDFPDYRRLWEWSVSDLEGFWGSIWDFFGVRSVEPRGSALGERRTMPGTDWFPGTRVNYAEQVLAGRPPEEVAIIAGDESGAMRELSWADLAEETARIRVGLIAAGVGRGDRVAAILPNIPQAVAALMATASLGAIWSCVAPEMGAASTIDRFSQIEPKVLIAVDGYRYNGRDFDISEAVAAIVATLGTGGQTFVLPVLDRPLAAGCRPWDELIADRGPLEFEPVPFAHPLWILYSSGTTGPPKAIVHGHGGIVLEHLKKLHLHVDARPGERIFWFTTTGWMMWNFLVGALLTGATAVLYDGSPMHDGVDALWRFAAASRSNCFGASAGYLTTCMVKGVEPRDAGDLSALSSIGSTGSPLAPEAFDWVYRAAGPDVWLFSSSGGTDLCTSFLGGVPTLPVYRGELQARSLGAAVVALDSAGNQLDGEMGELVITEPMPSMPVCFWGDEDGERLRDTYFSSYPGLWRHGDWIELTPNDGVVVHGRSDSTINRGGIRMGTSEIYRVVLRLDEVVDALVVDVPRGADTSWMPLFVVLREGLRLDEELEGRIRARLRADLSPRHVPNAVIQVPEVPRTRSGKLLEVPVKRILMGESADLVTDRAALANPEAMDPFVALAAGGAAMVEEAGR
jgi:acetoacetyl-CoA synthetase